MTKGQSQRPLLVERRALPITDLLYGQTCAKPTNSLRSSLVKVAQVASLRMSIVDNGQREGGWGGRKVLVTGSPAAETWRDHHFSPFVN